MKGLIVVRNPKNVNFCGEVTIPNNGHLLKVDLKNRNGRVLKKVSIRSESAKRLECLIGKAPKRVIIFRFNDMVLYRNHTINAQNLVTGKRVPWICRFQKTGD